MERCLACEADAVGAMEGSRLLDNFSEVRRLFARSAKVTGNLQKRHPSGVPAAVGLASEAALYGRATNHFSPLTSHFSRVSRLYRASQRLQLSRS
jgi:hypothetical protein